MVAEGKGERFLTWDLIAEKRGPKIWFQVFLVQERGIEKRGKGVRIWDLIAEEWGSEVLTQVF